MRLLITANTLGQFRELKKDAEFSKADNILIAGNVGIRNEGEYKEFYDGDFTIDQPIYCITGKYEDFSFLHTHVAMGLTVIDEKPIDVGYTVAGVSGTYSPNFYDKESAPPRHMLRKNLFAVPKGVNVVLLHNVPGQLAKNGSLDFHDDVFNFIDSKLPKYIFIGGYDRFSHFRYFDTTVVFLASLRKGYALVDTEDWSCFIQHKIL